MILDQLLLFPTSNYGDTGTIFFKQTAKKQVEHEAVRDSEAGFRLSAFITTTVGDSEQHPRSHHKGATQRPLVGFELANKGIQSLFYVIAK